MEGSSVQRKLQLENTFMAIWMSSFLACQSSVLSALGASGVLAFSGIQLSLQLNATVMSAQAPESKRPKTGLTHSAAMASAATAHDGPDIDDDPFQSGSETDGNDLSDDYFSDVS